MHVETKKPEQLSRIQRANRTRIREAALEAFSTNGFRGTTLDQISGLANLSKSNLIYYYSSKEDIYLDLFAELLEQWLEPLITLGKEGDPIEEILSYVQAKLALSRDKPRESRLFANEILRGCPRISGFIKKDLKAVVVEVEEKFQHWMDAGKIAETNPRHLLYSIWAVTQHYADFESQITLLEPKKNHTFAEAEIYVDQLFRGILTPRNN